MLRPVLAVPLLLQLLPAQQQDPAPPPRRLRDLEVRVADVFTDQQATDNPVYRLANTLHVISDPDVVAREVWLRRGEPITADDVAEIERNLRRLGLFGAVRGELVPVGDDEADLQLTTRDNFSLVASANFARVGGKSRLAFDLAENNLLGSGKAIAASSSRSDDHRSDSVAYYDRQLLGGRHTLSLQAGRTEDGDFASVSLQRPFRRQEDPYSYGIEIATAATTIDYYQLGDLRTELPVERRALRLFAATGSGPRELRQAFGIDLRLRDADYDAVRGTLPVRTPGDKRELDLGPYWTLDWRPRFLRVQGLDSLDYDEDLALGTHVGAVLAGRLRDVDGLDAYVEPVFGCDWNFAAAPIDDTFVTLATAAEGRSRGDAAMGWRASAGLHVYHCGLPAQTLCASFTADAAFEREDYDVQFTLGEDNGLRGYPAREFAGTRRLRLNVEDRIDTGVELLSVRLGLCAFADVGWIQDPLLDQSLGRPVRGVGCGFRFGSSHLLGNRILRLDVAWPLDDPFDQGYGTSVSFAIGQVFTFFGNANNLGGTF